MQFRKKVAMVRADVSTPSDARLQNINAPIYYMAHQAGPLPAVVVHLGTDRASNGFLRRRCNLRLNPCCQTQRALIVK
jgi:hypothetical protein